MVARRALLVLLTASVCAVPVSAEIQIVVDSSVSMWERLGNDAPRVVALRRALANALTAAALDNDDLEIALRTVGGHHELIDDGGCLDTELALPPAALDRDRWRRALAELYPLGRRPLELAVEQALSDLALARGPRRLVLVTSGNDSCGGDIGPLLEDLVERDSELEIRIVGLGLDRQMANAATLLVPTRNVYETPALAEALEWALTGDGDKPRTTDFEVTVGERPVESGIMRLSHALHDLETTATIDRGAARARLEPGVYEITIAIGETSELRISGFEVAHGDRTALIAVDEFAPATLEVSPELPWSSGTAYVHFWGAPVGRTTIVIAEPDAAPSEWLVGAEAPEGTGEVPLRLPGLTRELEARMLHHIGSGGVRVIGRTSFAVRSPTVALDLPDAVEIGTPLRLAWDGPELPGDHLTIVEHGRDTPIVCVPAGAGDSRVVTAPVEPGVYTVRYLTAMGDTIARTDIEIFEILATLDARPHVPARSDVEVAWTGPADEHDFISLAAADAPPDTYLEWVPASDGSPIRLPAPAEPGGYEVRYVRGSDNEILARHDLEVVTVDLALEVPARVRAGTRFTVRLRGTTTPGDIIAVAAVGAGVDEHLDWIDADAGRPLSLAAPFEPGTYEVRYISGSELEIRVRSTFTAR